jgi:hypothetical protein
MHKPFLITLSRLSGLVLITFICLIPALAQSTGGVKGKIRNLRGDRIADATITARQNSRDVRSVKSNAKGEFVLDGLEIGFYNILVDAPGYSTGIKNNVEIKRNKTVDLGDRLFLSIDKGTQVIVNGSVFYKDGTSVTGAKVVVEKIGQDGSSQKIGTFTTDISGEFTFRQPDNPAKFRITAKHKDVSATKEIDVESAAVYRLAISLDTLRNDD